MDALVELAAEWGIEPDYVDGRGLSRTVDRHILQRIVEILSRGQSPLKRRKLPKTLVLRQGRGTALALPDATPSASIHWAVVSGDTRIAGGTAASVGALPDDLPVGTFRLDVEVKSHSEQTSEHATLLVAPERAHGGRDFADGRRVWALGVQLYGARSHRNWGHGDFTDLLGLLELSADLGAAGIGLNPLHSLFAEGPERASPYSPNSRLFLNPLYIDLETVPEFPGLAAAGLTQEVARLRGAAMVDYTGVAAAKLAGLRLAFDTFRARGSAQRREDFEAFRREQGRALALFASFEALRRKFGCGWPDWPSQWRRPDEPALETLRRSAGEEVEFHEFVQWLADRQLRACQVKAQRLGMPLGLYLDVAIGVDPRGADAWSEQSTMLADASIGAPPDLLNTAGQNWSLVTFNPKALEQQGFAPFRALLQAAMRYAGAIRLDHVLGLNRVYLIPNGASAGAYVRFPLEAMLAVVAQESVGHRCVIIGEDLGTVPENLRETLADWGVWSYRVMLFERGENGSFRPPEHYPEDALVTFSTHDLPTFAGWSVGSDLREKRALGIDPGETDADRTKAQAALRAALAKRRGKERSGSGLLPVARYLAATPSRILMISMEDALGVLDQPNIPGTIDEHPNWRRRLPVALEDLRRHPRLRALARVLCAAGRSLGNARINGRRRQCKS
jgi:4-alpha-glucanotransferase